MNKTVEWVLKIVAVVAFGILLVLLASDGDNQTLEVVTCGIASLCSLLLIKNKKKID